MGRQSARAAEWLSDRVLESLSGGAAEHLSGRALEAEQQSAEIVHRQSDQKLGKPRTVGRSVRRMEWKQPNADAAECFRAEESRAEEVRSENVDPRGTEPKGIEQRGVGT